MPRYSGVKEYITGTATVTVHFPVDYSGKEDVSCYQCGYYSFASHRCKLNDEVPEYPQKYIGSKCPLIFNEGDEE